MFTTQDWRCLSVPITDGDELRSRVSQFLLKRPRGAALKGAVLLTTGDELAYPHVNAAPSNPQVQTILGSHLHCGLPEVTSIEVLGTHHPNKECPLCFGRYQHEWFCLGFISTQFLGTMPNLYRVLKAKPRELWWA